LPESTIDTIEVPWQGQVYKLGSTHTFPEWTITFNVDQDADIIRNFNLWSKMIHDPATNVHGNPSLYMGQVVAELLDVTGDPVSTYVMFLCWPSSVGAVEVAHDNKEVAQLDVTFQYQYHLVF
jgi:hypothetical protein